MARLSFSDFAARHASFVEAVFAKARNAPRGYTANTLITEWLTLNCRGDWASQAAGRAVRVRFAEAADRDRALAHFGGGPA